MVRAVNTGIINLSLAVQETDVKLQREREALAKGKLGIAGGKSEAKPTAPRHHESNVHPEESTKKPPMVDDKLVEGKVVMKG